MTRIAGLTARKENRPPTDELQQMLRLSQSIDGEHTTSESIGNCTIGSTGLRTNSCICINGVLVALDGSIFNRDQLGQFRTDVEAIIELYKQHGFPAALAKLNGDFAIALYDSRDDALWLGRDRFGVKPLYYHIHGSSFSFASRLRALLSLPQVSSRVNDRYVALFASSHYRFFDNDPESSPFAEIKQLPASHALCFKNGSVSKTRYWALEEQTDWTDSEKELSERYRQLLLDAVSIRLRVAERPAFTLSGGMDSSSMLACAVHISGQKQHAFSTVYSDKTFDESEDIRTVLDSTVEHWHRVPVDDPDVFGIIEEMVQVHDEPVATATWLSHYLLCRDAAEQGFGGLFGGLGGDELNAGEFEHFTYFFADLKMAGQEQRLSHEIDKWIEYHDHPIYIKTRGLVDEQFSTLVNLSIPGKCIPDRRRLLRYKAALNPDFFDLDDFEPVSDHPFSSYLKNRTYQDLVRETIPCCLRAEDRQSAAFGLDCFLPFFDHRLVEFMFRVPSTLKYRAGVTKNLLRNAMRGILPEETRTRVAKTGWNAPAHLWFSNGCGDQLMDMLHSREFRERGIYNVAEVERLFDEHRRIVTSGAIEENHMMFFWQLVNLELWLQHTDNTAGVDD
jgi:asparagine synthase (glutamine-hydrolysing)